MKRREFLTLLSGAAAAWPVGARAQQKRVIGLVGGSTAEGWAPFVTAFRQGLSEAGYGEGRNVAIEYRWADGNYDRLPALAADLINRQVSVIAAFTTPAALAAKAATTTIPIVFTTTGDPVQMGLVTTLGRPGGNVTGVTQLNEEVGPKLLELLREVIPAAVTIAVLVNPTNPNTEIRSRDLRAAARTFGLQLHFLNANTEADFDAAFATLHKLGADALVIAGDPFFNARSKQLAVLALRQAVPAIYQPRAFVEAGGLMSYAGSQTDQYRQVGIYVGRILKGEKPADLPVQRATKVELIINLRTAKALGLTVPLSLLGRADEVIE
jgi:putative ABC transport system substrate-binding protein